MRQKEGEKRREEVGWRWGVMEEEEEEVERCEFRRRRGGIQDGTYGEYSHQAGIQTLRISE